MDQLLEQLVVQLHQRLHPGYSGHYTRDVGILKGALDDQDEEIKKLEAKNAEICRQLREEYDKQKPKGISFNDVCKIILDHESSGILKKKKLDAPQNTLKSILGKNVNKNNTNLNNKSRGPSL
jgi:uncharacterized membrane-anchored protein